MKTMLQQYKAARRVGTPLIAIKTFDPEKTMQTIQKDNGIVPLIFWEVVDGLHGRNKEGEAALQEALQQDSVDSTIDLVQALTVCKRLPFKADTDKAINPVVFIMNAHRHLDKPEVAQAVWNCREPFKKTLRSVVLLGPTFQLPSELQQDVLELDEPLPDETELREVVDTIARVGAVTVDEPTRILAVNALMGLSTFPAEQSVALSIRKNALDINELWERKRNMIRQTAGLSVWNGGESFDGLGGLDEIKLRLKRIIGGKARPRVVVFIDEIEKGMAGTGPVGDSSGTSQDQLGVTLSEMQDMEYTGLLGLGVPGSGKSELAKAFANEIGVLTVKLDFGALKNSLVGSSEERIRQAMKVISAVGGGKGGAFFIATSNDIRVVRPELKRRFTKGIWFFDLPTEEERRRIWEIYLKKYKGANASEAAGRMSKELWQLDWTGAEIRTCVSTAWEEDITLEEAARSIVPVAISGKEDIERLRSESSGRYNSTTVPGTYKYHKIVGVESTGERMMAAGE